MKWESSLYKAEVCPLSQLADETKMSHELNHLQSTKHFV